MNSGAFDEAAFDFLVSDEGGANVAVALGQTGAPPPRAPAFRHRAAKRADKPDSVRTARPKVRGPWQPFL